MPLAATLVSYLALERRRGFAHGGAWAGRCSGSALALALIANIASAQSNSELAELINAYRSVPQTCEGARTTAAGPLAPNPALASGRLQEGARILDALKARGYQAASAHVIVVSGPPGASAVMNYIAPRYCGPLLSQQYSEVGVRREANHWQIVLARPLLSPNLGDWRHAGNEVLRLTNAARAESRACGGHRFGAAPPLEWDSRLAAAALVHSRDMANRNYLDHVGKGGSHADNRATQEGYSWREVGENVASGHGSPAQVVAGWLSSPDHCVNIMNSRFTQMGAAYGLNPRSDSGIYWTQVFGTPR